MGYNLTVLGNTQTVRELFVYSNTVTNNMFMNLFIVCIFFVFFLSMKRYSFTNALLASSFMVFTLSLFLLLADLVSIMYPLIFGAVMAFTAFYAYVIDKG